MLTKSRPFHVVFFLRQLNTNLTSLIWSLRKSPYKVTVVVPKSLDHQWTDHEITVNYVFTDPHIVTKDYHDPVPDDIDLLIAQWTHTPSYPRFAETILAKYAAAARRKILNYDADFGDWWSLIKQQLRLARYCPWLFRSFRQIQYRSGWYPFDLFSFFGTREPVVVGPNFNHLVDEAAGRSLCEDWDARVLRPGFINYFGPYERASRKPIITAIEELGRSREDAMIITAPILNFRPGEGQQVWSFGPTYSWNTYSTALTLFDFTLCPQGGMPWAHRTSEALMRGSIPILPKRSACYFGNLLVDGKTCILVRNMTSPKCWREAVGKALAFSVDQRVSMRQAIYTQMRTWRSDLTCEFRRNGGICS